MDATVNSYRSKPVSILFERLNIFKNFAYVAVQLWRAKNDELEPEFISWKIWSLRVLNSKSWKT